MCLLSCCFSRVWLFAAPWTVASQAPLSMGFLKQEYWSGLPCLPPGDIPNPGIKPWSPALQEDFFTTWATKEYSEIFKNIQEYSRNIHWPSSEYSGLISFRVDWFGLLTLQGTVKSLLQHHSLKASILQHSAFFCCCCCCFRSESQYYFNGQLSIISEKKIFVLKHQ